MPPILSLKNFSVHFESGALFDGLTFDIHKGDNLAVIGPNGAGKTVFLKALLGMIPYEGVATWGAGVRIGYVPQKVEVDKHLPMNMGDLFAAKAHILKVKKTRVSELAQWVGISEKLLKTPVGHLSGGEFQKALIAFALIGDPSVLFFDEPTASIDAPREEEIYELIHELQDKFELTVVTVSHDIGFVYRYANRVLCLNKLGLCFGAPEEVLTRDLLEKVYGASPKFYHHTNNHRGEPQHHGHDH